MASTRPRVAVLDDYGGVALGFGPWERLRDRVEVEVFRHALPTLAEQAEALAPFDVLCLMRERMALPGDLIRRLPNLKLVAVTGTRLRTIDLDAATERGIPVCHTRQGDTLASTTELAWGLILSAARDIAGEHRGIGEGGWQRGVGTVLAGGTVGILGLGRLGSRMVPVARALGLEVLAWSPNLDAARASAAGARRVSKEELFRLSDVVTLHMVLSPATRGLVGAREIALMKPGAILVNTSRGPLVDEEALVAALEEGRIRAGLDVFDREPLPADHPLRRAPNAVLTPHIGYVTRTAYAAFFLDTVENIEAWLAGRPVRLLNPEAVAGSNGGGRT